MLPHSSSLNPRWLVRLSLAVAFVSLLLLFQNHGLNFLPAALEVIPAASIRPLSGSPSFAYVTDFNGSAADGPFYKHSRIQIYEDGNLLHGPHAEENTIAEVGTGLWKHQPRRLVFSSSDNTDPRTNGREYSVLYPRFQQDGIGYAAALLFGISVYLLRKLGARPPQSLSQPRPAHSLPRSFRWQVGAATLLFVLGLYLNTGTLSPYASNVTSHVDAHGYLFNTDHPHFVTLFKFVDGKPASEWEGAIFFRRILYPVFAYPFMKLAGFEIGGIIASALLNLFGFGAFVWFVLRRIGARGALLTAWLLALYPGTFYWSGMPYFYAAIVPCSLLLTIGLWELEAKPALRNLILLSLGMGCTYLAYDLIAFFLPASVVLLCWRKRWGAAVISGAIQIVPLVSWLLFLKYGLHQNLATSNSGSIGAVINSYLHPQVTTQWLDLLRSVPGIALDIFFSANFMFLPLLVLALFAINTVTSRVPLTAVEGALIAATLALFLFCHLAPPYMAAWPMRGTWLSRIYQPAVPVFFLFAARWVDALPPLSALARRMLFAGGAAWAVSCSLVVFGPSLGNPFGISEECFFRFYDTIVQTSRDTYERNLAHHGRRPLGF